MDHMDSIAALESELQTFLSALELGPEPLSECPGCGTVSRVYKSSKSGICTLCDTYSQLCLFNLRNINVVARRSSVHFDHVMRWFTQVVHAHKKAGIAVTFFMLPA